MATDATAADRLLERVESLRRGQPARAWQVLGRGFGKAHRGAVPAKRGELWRLRAHVLRSLRRSHAAAHAYRRAERWFERAGDARERGRCAIGLVDSLMYLGRYDEALEAASRGRRLLARAHDPGALARLANNEGNLFHRLDRPDRALERYRDARRALRRAGDERGAAMVSGNIANCLSLLGRSAEARRLYLEAERAHATANFPLDALRARYNLAYVDFLDQHHESALESLGAIADEARSRSYPSLMALAALDRAEILLRMGVHEEALAEAQIAIHRCAGLGLTYERAKAEVFAALAEHRLGRRASARQRLERSLAAFHAEGNAVWSGEALVGVATVWWRDGNPRAAAALLGAARRRFALARDGERECCSLALLARARLECGRRKAAEQCLDDLHRRSGRRPSPRLRHLALAAEASAARSSGDLARARRLLRRAASEAERLASRILDEQWRSTFWGEWGWPHLELAALELRAGRIAEALETLEAGRGRALIGPSAAGAPSRPARLPKAVRGWAARHLARERDRMSRSATEVPPLPARDWAAGHPSTLRRVLEGLPARSIRAEALRRSLAGDQLLIDYFLHQGVLGAIAVTRQELAGRAELVREPRLVEFVHSLLFELRGAAFTPARERPDSGALRERLAELAALILWPALGDARAFGQTRSLAIVPAGPLARIPWAALPLPDGRLVCESMDLVVVPGLRLAMAKASRPAGDVGVRGASPLVVASDAGELENVEPETRMVLDCFPGAELLSRERATADRFLELAPHAPWIHFAGHGIYLAEAPHQSALRFADRWLAAHELAGLGLSASWVTLSACQTARALVRPGEEWFGLPRALLLGGAQGVLASQWDVDDRATARLMADVYRGLKSGMALGAALGGAQAARSAAQDHPLDWAGFVLLGGPDAATKGMQAVQ